MKKQAEQDLIVVQHLNLYNLLQDKQWGKAVSIFHCS